MAARAAIRERQMLAQKKLEDGLEAMAGRRVRENLSQAHVESRDPAWIEMRRLEILADTVWDLHTSHVIQEQTDIESLQGLGPEMVARIKEAGYLTKDDLRKAPNEDLMKIKGLGHKLVRQIRKQL